MVKADLKKSSGERKWWQKPGLGIMYQIEYRPGWGWKRDFEKFNAEMTDKEGRLKFNGPFCKTADWIDLSRQLGVDYHVMEIKWHDGICYFKTDLTEWKTDVDYAGQFADLSREAGIPFMFYYSAIIDHNPQFDSIQPKPKSTLSLINYRRRPIYEDYLRGQYREIIEQYHPDGMWIDWYFSVLERSAGLSLDFIRKNYPEIIITQNGSNIGGRRIRRRLDYTSGEAHDVDGLLIKYGYGLPVFSSAWRWANLNRRRFDHPWELISACGSFWHDISPRTDPNTLIRILAINLACGGKHCIGIAADLEGNIYPKQVRQMQILSEWYRPRKELFTEAIPLRYPGKRAAGVCGCPRGFGTIATRLGDDVLLHLINKRGKEGQINLELHGWMWEGLKRIYLEPGHKKLDMEKSSGGTKLFLKPEEIDPIDTILRVEFG